MTFKELNLSPKIMAAIEAAGYTEPTPIQKQAIPPAIEGRDILGIAQTGTGKTASFAIPMLTRLERGRARARMPRTLVLTPTRELAAQIEEAFEQLGVNFKLTIALLIGGVSFAEQTKKLDRGADILIATPGRMMDHFQRGKILLTGVEILVIDEADRMLDMGFIDDIKKICGLLPPRKQTMFFSATMPPEILKFTKSFLNDPVRIEIARQSTVADTITQRFEFSNTDASGKRAQFREAINALDIENAIIFCNRKRDVALLHKSMTKHGYNAGALHGDMEQRERMATLERFRNNEIKFLVASDVAARGLDVPNVGHVINYDVPTHAEDYIHRIGRTGRAGREGYAATFVTPIEKKYIDAILDLCKIEPEWIGDAPTSEDFKGSRGRGRGKPSRNSPREKSTSSDREKSTDSGNRSKNPPEAAKSTSNNRVAKGRTQTKPQTTQPENKRQSTKTTIDEKAKPTENPRTKRQDIDKTTKKNDDRHRNHSNKRSHSNKPRESVIGMGDHVPAFMKRNTPKDQD